MRGLRSYLALAVPPDPVSLGPTLPASRSVCNLCFPVRVAVLLVSLYQVPLGCASCAVFCVAVPNRQVHMCLVRTHCVMWCYSVPLSC
ncbi:hypothetical protein [Streptomyces phage phiScoe55]|nr:hypothetical protein [Streptomyces phage phiScoe55]